MGTRERRQREKEEIRGKILRAAVELFLEDGYRNVTIRKIADIIEYSPPVIYEYFKDKADILLHIFYEDNGMLMEKLEEVYRRRDLSPVEKMREMGREYIRFGLDNPHFYELAFISNILRFETGLPYYDKDSPGSRAFDLLVTAVGDCNGQAVLGDDDIIVLSETLWAGMHGLTSLLITHPEFPWAQQDKLIKTMLDTLMKALPAE
ncbi:MAG TPA: TetR/AcrR family transcriptional regulator [Spirochaetia bacterium]|nr:TetR/AcrR family transcriptional regulator [Spirochaetia bacterium]